MFSLDGLPPSHEKSRRTPVPVVPSNLGGNKVGPGTRYVGWSQKRSPGVVPSWTPKRPLRDSEVFLRLRRGVVSDLHLKLPTLNLGSEDPPLSLRNARRG